MYIISNKSLVIFISRHSSDTNSSISLTHSNTSTHYCDLLYSNNSDICKIRYKQSLPDNTNNTFFDIYFSDTYIPSSVLHAPHTKKYFYSILTQLQLLISQSNFYSLIHSYILYKYSSYHNNYHYQNIHTFFSNN